MKKSIFIAGIIIGCFVSAFSQNYISGTVRLQGDNTAVGTTTVASGASLIFNNSKLYEQSGFINKGDSVAIRADSGTLVLSGTTQQTITGRFALGALQLNNSSGAAINNSEPVTMVTILDSVSFGSINGTTLNTGYGLLTLRSTALKTARIADLTHNEANTGNTITGSVVAERYLRSRRAWRLLSPPTTADSVNDQTISQAWQEGARNTYGQLVNPNPGYGTVITRPGANPPPATTGYDDGVPGTITYSLHSYLNNGQYTQPSNTDYTHFSAHAAYLLFVRGDRSVSPATQTSTVTTPSNITTLRSRGTLHNGTIIDTVTNAAGGYAGVSNPYASTIDFSKVELNGVVNGFYVFDPTINTLGGWIYIDGNYNYRAVPGGTSTYNNPATNVLVQSGQAILVRTIGNTGTIKFKESNKDISSRANGFRQMPLSSLSVNLYTGDSSHQFLDGTTAVFNSSFSKDALPDEDIYKPENQNVNFSFYAGNNYLMEEKWPMPAAGDTLPLRLWKISAAKYRFTVNISGLASSPQPYLFDKYLHSSTAIRSDSINYDFDITNDSASKANDRFGVVFGETVLPVSLVHINADLVTNGVAVQWQVANEVEIISYDIERSTDGGRVFSKIGSTPVHVNNLGNDAYNFLDEKPLEGDNYYRIKMIDLNGKYKYTNVVKVTKANDVLTVGVYPNPVINQLMNVNFSNSPAGRYLITLHATDGKQIFAKTITHLGGNATYKISIGTVAQGLYYVEVTDDKNKKITLNVVIN